MIVPPAGRFLWALRIYRTCTTTSGRRLPKASASSPKTKARTAYPAVRQLPPNRIQPAKRSPKNDCAAGGQVSVGTQDLQDMHNDFRSKITEGLGKLAENQGKNGIPSGPPAASKPNPAGQAQPDLTGWIRF